jgi:hypothetical protein
MKFNLVFAAILALAFNVPALVAKKAVADPDECQVCVEVLDAIDALVDKKEKASQVSIEVYDHAIITMWILHSNNRKTIPLNYPSYVFVTFSLSLRFQHTQEAIGKYCSGKELSQKQKKMVWRTNKLSTALL